MERGAQVTIGGTLLTLGGVALAAWIGAFEDGRKAQQESYAVYADTLAGGLPTACYGITKWTSPVPVIVGEVWSREKCERIANQVIVDNQLRLAACLRLAPPDSVFHALTSHAHNFGAGDTCGSLAMEAVNRGEFAAACDLLAWTPAGRPNWAYVDGRFVQGLHNRRLAERRLCLSGID